MQRRTFLQALTIALSSSLIGRAAQGRPPRILLRSSWQTVNIGDIAHTPGVLALLEQYLPEAEIYLWPSKLDNGVDQLLLDRFPKLKLAQGTKALQEAFQTCDFLLHSSGASLVAERDVIKWHNATGKPYGIYGITLPPRKSSATEDLSQDALSTTVQVLNQAQFVYFRDSKSLAFAKQLGCECPIMEFGPDGAFACDLKDEAKAKAFLKKHQLEDGKFLCCIPRLRYTPYWTIPSKNRPLDPVKHARNEEMKEHDHHPLRQAIEEVVRQTDLKVLVCPEDQTQMKVGKEMLLDQLSENAKKKVVWRPNYWLTGEAVSTYVRSAGLFGNEMHSPIMCIGHGVPAIVCRWAEQTTKGYMWEDIGLGEWLFNLDHEDEVERVVPTVLEMAKNPQASKAKALKAQAFVHQRQQETMNQLKLELSSL
ncbi:Polysaccharide pyruvyl transferase [Planctomycetales bacterium 10988]|nr:Polysaccharide pyruvyl transferase [Planctomycetales bacterium 10988]